MMSEIRLSRRNRRNRPAALWIFLESGTGPNPRCFSCHGSFSPKIQTESLCVKFRSPRFDPTLPKHMSKLGGKKALFEERGIRRNRARSTLTSRVARTRGSNTATQRRNQKETSRDVVPCD